jgi:hypothetical protein
MTMRVVDIRFILRPQLTLMQLKDRQRSEQNLKYLQPIEGRAACGSNIKIPGERRPAWLPGPQGWDLLKRQEETHPPTLRRPPKLRDVAVEFPFLWNVLLLLWHHFRGMLTTRYTARSELSASDLVLGEPFLLGYMRGISHLSNLQPP